MNRLSVRNKQNQNFTALQPRQSLKKTMTSRKKPQRNQTRMSMLPLKRQRAPVTIENQLKSQRPSISALSQNSNLLNTLSMNHSFYNSARKSITKQTIISNLVNKLDEKEQIRSIIETKLKRSCYDNNKEVVYTSDFQPFASVVSLQKGGRNHNVMQSSKKSGFLCSYGDEILQHQHQNGAEVNLELKKCQQELAYFKSIVGDLEKKVKRLEGDYKTKLSTDRHKNKVEPQILNCDECTKCCKKCKSNQQKKKFKKVSNVQIQTDQHQQKQQQNPDESDFFDNLQKTLRVLDRTKMF